MMRTKEQAKRDVGDRIYYQRKKLKITLQELSDRSGVLTSAISRYETHKILPSITKVERIATALNVSPAWLAGWENMK